MCGIPVRSFERAKTRLGEAVPPAIRRLVVERMAARTVAAAGGAGMEVVVLTADEAVAAWAESSGRPVLGDGAGTLDGGARALVEEAGRRQRAWAVLHADLPLIAADDLTGAAAALEAGRAVIAPSSDGGTSLIGTPGPGIAFAYGPGSFKRHLARVAGSDPLVLVSAGLACDLDVPSDLTIAAARPEGAWLADLVGTLPDS
jgi:2-phospho-L-lactate guanylyltransferase